MPSGSMKVGRGRKKIDVSELQVGMFVSDLDRDWLQTPFLMQGFRINSLDDIETVRRYCDYVWIDTLTWNYVDTGERPGSARVTSQPRRSYVNQRSAREEHARAFGIHRQARQLTKSLLDEARLGQIINTEAAKETVKECVDSVIRNPDAMLWMTRIRKSDQYTAEHCINVCVLSIALGRHLGMEESDLNKLGLCGLLHDVGKMKIPAEVLNKPGKLTDKEFRMVKAHTVHGRNLLMSSLRKDSYMGVVDVAYSHHERMDGKGYPRALKASGISTFSRMVAIVDAYDAMTSTRCYDKARPSTEALSELFRCRESQFDPFLTEQFIEMIGLYPPGCIVELENGQAGIVFETNPKFRHLPKVLLLRDSRKEVMPERVVALGDIQYGALDESYLIKRVVVDGTFGISLQEYRDKGLQLNFS